MTLKKKPEKRSESLSHEKHERYIWMTQGQLRNTLRMWRHDLRNFICCACKSLLFEWSKRGVVTRRQKRNVMWCCPRANVMQYWLQKKEFLIYATAMQQPTCLSPQSWISWTWSWPSSSSVSKSGWWLTWEKQMSCNRIKHLSIHLFKKKKYLKVSAKLS